MSFPRVSLCCTFPYSCVCIADGSHRFTRRPLAFTRTRQRKPSTNFASNSRFPNDRQNGFGDLARPSAAIELHALPPAISPWYPFVPHSCFLLRVFRGFSFCTLFSFFFTFAAFLTELILTTHVVGNTSAYIRRGISYEPMCVRSSFCSSRIFSTVVRIAESLSGCQSAVYIVYFIFSLCSLYTNRAKPPRISFSYSTRSRISPFPPLDS